MDRPTNRSLPSAGLPATAPSTALDAHRFRAEDYDWVPVRRQPRNDGWSHERQRGFIEALADGGSVMEAARQIGMSASGAYRLRRSPGGEAFAAAWDAAIHQAALHLVDVAFDRALHGSDEPVFDKEGRRVGRRMRQNDRLLMFLLRAHLPERYAPDRAAHAHRGDRPAAPPLPLVAPVAHALAVMSPPVPEEPERLMAPDRLAQAIDFADLYDGAIPARLRDHDGPADDAPDGDTDPLGAAFERDLESAKRAADTAPPPDYCDYAGLSAEELDDDEDDGDLDDGDLNDGEDFDDENPGLA